MTPEQFQKLLEKFSRGQCTPAEEQFIIEWYERIHADESPAQREEEGRVVRERIWSAINPQPETKPNKSLRFLARAAVITIPLLAFALIYFIYGKPFSSIIEPLQQVVASAKDDDIRYSNDGYNAMEISLPDGSHITLQPSSEIVLHKDFGHTTRSANLDGEAFFDVKPDTSRPFLVYANEVVTRVLGTSFHIRAYDNDGEVTVAVQTGKVSVYANNNRTSHQATKSPEVILLPNQQMVYHRLREVISKTLVAEPEIIAPNSNLFQMRFDNAEVSELFAVLAENYGVEIRYDKELLRNCRLTTSMSDEGLYERIQVICKAIGASYSIDDDAAITIKSNGC